MLELELAEIQLCIEDIIQDAWGKSLSKQTNKRLREQYQKYRTAERLWQYAVKAGWEEFDWKQAHEDGWLSAYGYKTFWKSISGAGVPDEVAEKIIARYYPDECLSEWQNYE